jgi:hypothetical protein
MNKAEKPLTELVQELPPDLQGEVRDFVEFLIYKRQRTPPTMSALDVIAASPGRRAFHSAAEVAAYLAEERSAWDR